MLCVKLCSSHSIVEIINFGHWSIEKRQAPEQIMTAISDELAISQKAHYKKGEISSDSSYIV